MITHPLWIDCKLCAAVRMVCEEKRREGGFFFFFCSFCSRLILLGPLGSTLPRLQTFSSNPSEKHRQVPTIYLPWNRLTRPVSGNWSLNRSDSSFFHTIWAHTAQRDFSFLFSRFLISFFCSLSLSLLCMIQCGCRAESFIAVLCLTKWNLCVSSLTGKKQPWTRSFSLVDNLILSSLGRLQFLQETVLRKEGKKKDKYRWKKKKKDGRGREKNPHTWKHFLKNGHQTISSIWERGGGWL